MALNPDELKRVLSPVVVALNEDRNTEAVRRFVEICAHSPALPDDDLVRILTARIGKTATIRLIRAFAKHPCVGCNNGLETCEECEGKGIDASNRVCESCIGLGVTDCGFCGGSGFVTYNFVPAGLRLVVVLERSQLVISRIKALLASPPPDVEQLSVAKATKAVSQQLLVAHRLLDMLNNAVGATLVTGPGLRDERVRAKCRSACFASAARLGARVRQLLRSLHSMNVQAAAAADHPAKRRAFARRANFYKRVGNSPDFRGTGLYQVNLEKALRESAGGRSDID